MGEIGDHLITLGFLVLLQAVLGFDNLLYISLESKRAPAATQSRVRKLGIAIAVALRIVLLFALIRIVDAVKGTLFSIETGFVSGAFSFQSVTNLVGGAFILYTAVKEIWHMLSLDVVDDQGKGSKSATSVIALIVAMNLVFSFDSILSAMALTDNFYVMAVAIVISGILMIVLADRVSVFLQKNRTYEVLGLFILLIVGVMLLSEGGHMAALHLFGNEITPMSKATFYFVIAVLVLVDVVQGRYQSRIVAARNRSQG